MEPLVQLIKLSYPPSISPPNITFPPPANANIRAMTAWVESELTYVTRDALQQILTLIISDHSYEQKLQPFAVSIIEQWDKTTMLKMLFAIGIVYTNGIMSHFQHDEYLTSVTRRGLEIIVANEKVQRYLTLRKAALAPILHIIGDSYDAILPRMINRVVPFGLSVIEHAYYDHIPYQEQHELLDYIIHHYVSDPDALKHWDSQSGSIPLQAKARALAVMKVVKDVRPHSTTTTLGMPKEWYAGRIKQ